MFRWLDEGIIFPYKLLIGNFLCLIQHNGRTPLMEVVRSNMLDMVKVLIYATDDRAVWETKDNTDVDLSLQDNDGKSMIHHCVQNRKVRTKSNQVAAYTTVFLASWLGYHTAKWAFCITWNYPIVDCIFGLYVTSWSLC